MENDDLRLFDGFDGFSPLRVEQEEYSDGRTEQT